MHQVDELPDLEVLFVLHYAVPTAQLLGDGNLW